MGYLGTTIEDCGYLKVVREAHVHTKHIRGECPMCGTKINRVFNLCEDDYYRCPCGYFSVSVDAETVSEDDHGTPAERWKERLTAALAEHDKLKQNDGRRYPIVKEDCPSLKRCVVRVEWYGGTWDVFQDLVGEARKDFPELQDNQIVVVKFGGTAYKQTYGIEFQVNVDNTPEGYREVHRLEITL